MNHRFAHLTESQSAFRVGTYLSCPLWYFFQHVGETSLGEGLRGDGPLPSRSGLPDCGVGL